MRNKFQFGLAVIYLVLAILWTTLVITEAEPLLFITEALYLLIMVFWLFLH